MTSITVTGTKTEVRTGGNGSPDDYPRGRVLENQSWVTALFSSTHFAWVWMLVRIYLGVSWLNSGWHKLSEEAWTGNGLAVKGFWTRAVAIPEEGRPAIAYDWYRDILEYILNAELYVPFGKLVAYGEVLVGIGLLVGALTGTAAFFGALMNWNFMLAGTASTNPLLGIIAIAIIVSWKTAGWWGIDRILLPYTGVPWERGKLLGGEKLSFEGEEPHTKARYVEEWIRMAIAAGVTIYALVYMESAPQITVIAFGVLMAATTGMGMFHATKAKVTA
jgi:thiosulfate dehydrogenase [quinone] large subunit